MQRFSLSTVRLMMNHPRSIPLPNAASFVRLATTTARQRNPSSGPGEEPWTQYDGLGPVPKAGKDKSRLDQNWRVTSSEKQRTRSNSGSRRQTSNKNSPKKKNSNDSKHTSRKTGKAGKSTQGMLLKRDIVDEEYLKRNYPRVTPADYPNAPKTLFENPKAFLWDFNGISAKSSFVSYQNDWYMCTIVVKSALGEVTAIGDAKNKKNAEKTACLHAILKLHQSGALRDVLTGGIHQAANDQALLKEEQDAKLDIYDYCGRFETLPQFNTRVAMAPGHRRTLVEVTVSMPKQNLKAVARAMDRRTADILACVEFKRLAEEHHAKHSDEDIVVKDITTGLNSRTAKQFLNYYQYYVDKRAKFDCELSTLPSNRLSNGYHQGQLTLDGEPIGEPVQMVNKKIAQTAAQLSGAIALKEKNPEIFPSFVNALRRGNGEVLKPLSPEWIDLQEVCLMAMTDTLISVKRIGLPRTEDEIRIEEEKENTHRSRFRRKLEPGQASIKSAKLLEKYQEYLQDPRLEILRKKRSELPMNTYARQVLDQVSNNDTSIIVGATGSGKTTQVPQILLEDAIQNGKGAECNIICTQPRRIAATSVAQRVSVERNERLQDSVGYHVRFDMKVPSPGGSITYCTTGILLQQLRSSPDETLDGVTHLVVDEVHERDIMIDYLLIILKRIARDRKRLGKPAVKIVLMSATMDTELFANYFKYMGSDGSYTNCPHLSVPGRTFPVKEFFLEDIEKALTTAYPRNELRLLNSEDTYKYLNAEHEFTNSSTSRSISRALSREEIEEDDDPAADATINWKQEVRIDSEGQTTISSQELGLVPIGLAALTLAHITKTTEDGAILVFLPGLDEILKLEKSLLEDRLFGVNFSDETKFRRYLLHSSIPNQNEVFEEVPPGTRKIILSTNIAETSITIPDVKFVIDTGKLREKQYEQARRITSLECTWVSKSNSKQRAGRAGRVQDGNYFALFSRARHESFRATGLPEILRSDLQEICLDIKMQGFKDPIAQFLSEAIEPPKPQAIQASLRQLRALGGLDEKENLTPLGRALGTMPVEPALGKMIILAVVFRCLDPIIILGASASGRDIFVNPIGRRAEAQRARAHFAGDHGSDHMAVINAYKQWRDTRDRDGPLAAQRFTEDNFLHRGALRTLDQTAKQIVDILADNGIIPRTPSVTRGFRNSRSEFGISSLNENSECVPLIKALTLAGMYPNIAVCTGGKRFRTIDDSFTMIHPSSVHYSTRHDDLVPLGTIMTFSQKSRSNDGSSILLRMNTQSTPLAAVLFGGDIRKSHNIIDVDEWLPFLARDNIARIIIEFKKCLDRLLANSFHSLYKKDKSNTRYLADDPVRETFAAGLVEVLSSDVGKRGRNYLAPVKFGVGSSSRSSSRGGLRNDSGNFRSESRNGDRERGNSRSYGAFGPGRWR